MGRVPFPVLPATDRHRHGVAIEAAAISKHHRGGTTALDGVTLAIRPGRLTAIVGPSGAGKTTLLTALAGITPVDEGTVSFRTGTRREADAHVGFVPQDDILHGELPLRRTLRYAAALRMSAPARALEDAVSRAMDTLGLAGLDDVPVRSLSGGQRKRASIACEILTRPAVCFLDEPTSGLDPAAAGALVALLHRMADQGSTIVFTTHSIADIEHSDESSSWRPAAGSPPSAPPRTSSSVSERRATATSTKTSPEAGSLGGRLRTARMRLLGQAPGALDGRTTTVARAPCRNGWS